VTVSGDAGHCCAATAADIYRSGGDYILQVKGNQPTLQKLCKATFACVPQPQPITEKEHGRLTERTAMALPATPAATNIPFCRCLVRIACKTTRRGVTTTVVRYYVSNRDLTQIPSDEIDAIVRTHWKACEIANHWIRDTFFREDDCRSRNPRIVLNLALLVNAAAFIVNTVRAEHRTPVPVQLENNAHYPAKAIALVTRSLRLKKR